MDVKKTVLRNAAQPKRDQAGIPCNCRKKDECSLEGNCLSKGIVYQATVTSENKTETCVGLTERRERMKKQNKW